MPVAKFQGFLGFKLSVEFDLIDDILQVGEDGIERFGAAMLVEGVVVCIVHPDRYIKRII
jgi:hypothetical protein